MYLTIFVVDSCSRLRFIVYGLPVMIFPPKSGFFPEELERPKNPQINQNVSEASSLCTVTFG